MNAGTGAPANRGIILMFRRGAGVDDRGGLENRCSLWATVGSNPTLSASMINEEALKIEGFLVYVCFQGV